MWNTQRKKIGLPPSAPSRRTWLAIAAGIIPSSFPLLDCKFRSGTIRISRFAEAQFPMYLDDLGGKGDVLFFLCCIHISYFVLFTQLVLFLGGNYGHRPASQRLEKARVHNSVANLGRKIDLVRKKSEKMRHRHRNEPRSAPNAHPSTKKWAKNDHTNRVATNVHYLPKAKKSLGLRPRNKPSAQ